MWDGLPSSDDLREFLKSSTEHEDSFLLLAALRDFGFTPTEEAARALLTLGKVLRMGYPPTRITLLTAPVGIEFRSCRARDPNHPLWGNASATRLS